MAIRLARHADADLVFDSTDKQGGFIGSMYAGSTNIAVELVREG